MQHEGLTWPLVEEIDNDHIHDHESHERFLRMALDPFPIQCQDDH